MLRLQESTDPVIRDFRLHGVPTKVTRVLPEISSEPDSINDAKQSNKTIELKNTYAKLLGQTRQYTRLIPLDAIEQMILERAISKASE